MGLLKKIYRYSREGELWSRIKGKIHRTLRTYVYIPLLIGYCGLADRWTDTSDGLHLLIYLRHSGFDATSLSLLSLLNDLPAENVEGVVLAVRSKNRLQDKRMPVQRYLEEDFRHDLTVVEKDTRAFVRVFCACNAIVLTSKDDLWRYRLTADRSDRLITHIHHGIITKSIGNLTVQKMAADQSNVSTTIDPHPYGLASRFDRVDVRPIASEAERHFHSTAEARAPGIYEKWGYPRHERLRHLRSSSSSIRILPDEAKDALAEHQEALRILYAPTHYDGETVHPFRLPDFDFTAFVELLRRHNIYVYMRMHSVEEDTKVYQAFINHDRVVYAGYSFAPSSIEILDRFDGLITDYSSIYVDSLLLDRPILFLRGEHERFLKNRGLSFEDDTFFPGPKIDTFDRFAEELEAFAQGKDAFEEERQVVREVLLPELKTSFSDRFYEAWETASGDGGPGSDW